LPKPSRSGHRFYPYCPLSDEPENCRPVDHAFGEPLARFDDRLPGCGAAFVTALIGNERA